eukprot:3198513-Pyramimonas_sp.AAC.2
MFAARRFFYASSACIYPEGKQLTTDLDGAGGLKEADAWPAEVCNPPPLAGSCLTQSGQTLACCRPQLLYPAILAIT